MNKSLPKWQQHDLELRKEYEQIMRRQAIAVKMIGWMKRIPIVGRFVFDFWFSILDEGIYSTCKPRWGAMTFAYLNDGMKPTLWHTWRQITHDQNDPYVGIYVSRSGAPRSLAEAQAWEKEVPKLK